MTDTGIPEQNAAFARMTSLASSIDKIIETNRIRNNNTVSFSQANIITIPKKHNFNPSCKILH